jgi:hypothetical protein
MGELSDVTRRRIAAVLLAVCVAVAALAITDTGPFSDPPTEEERVADAVDALFGAAADGDFAAYCDALTPRARDVIRANAARLVEAGDVLKCEDILGVAGKKAFAGVDVRIRDVSVSGNRARVEANLKRPETSGIEPRTILLERSEAGEWKVSDPG